MSKCPICKREYTQRPAISRVDNHELICPICGIIEALEAAGISEELREKIFEAMNLGRNINEA